MPDLTTDTSAWVPPKTAIARDFGAACRSYNPAARLQRYMGQVMLDHLQAQWHLWRADQGPDILDLGCGTGWFTGRLAQGCGSAADTVTGADLSPGMLDYARSANPPGIRWLVADAESLPLADNSVDVVFSNLMIQWCSQPTRVLTECRRVLKPGGLVLVSTLLDGTLAELEQAWHLADPGHRHVNRFETEGDFRRQAWEVFPGSELTTESIALDYPSPLALLAELKAIGAGFKGTSRRLGATAPGRLKTMCRHYPIGSDGRAYATYRAGWLTCRLPY